MARQPDTGLDDGGVAHLRDELGAGRRPRVRVASGGQFPAGTVGTVVRVGDPALDGSDFITVRLKVGGVSDELQFAPKELSMPGRRRAAPAPAPKGSAAPAAAAPAKPAAKPAAKPEKPEKPAAKPEKAAAKPVAKAASAARRTSVPAVTLTIASSGSSWTVTAQRGARVVVKKAPVQPGVVAAVAGLLGEPAVDEAVAAVNDTAREEAEARAERLRAELAEVEAVLTSHRRP